MWLDHIIFILIGCAAFFTAVMNHGNDKKQQFSLIVTIFLFFSLLMPDVFTDGQIHAAGIAYDAIIMSCLYQVGCREYQRLILVYACLVANEFMMWSSLTYFDDAYFMFGQGAAWAMYLVLVYGLWSLSDGLDGVRRISDDFRRWLHRVRHHT